MSIAAYSPARSMVFRGVSWSRISITTAGKSPLQSSSISSAADRWSESRWRVIERRLMALKCRLLPDRSSFPETLPSCDLRGPVEMDLYYGERWRRAVARNRKTKWAQMRLDCAGFSRD